MREEKSSIDNKIIDELNNLTPTRKKSIRTLSASKLSLWHSCKLAFFLRYIMHEKVPEHIRLTFGKSIHYFLDRFYKYNYKSSDSFANQWVNYWFRTIAGENIKGKARENLSILEYPTFKKGKENGIIKIGNHIGFGDFFENGNVVWYNKGKIEQHPKVNLFWGYFALGKSILQRFYTKHEGKPEPFEREKRRKLEVFEHPTIVIFDRVDKFKDGQWIVTDYKTSKNPPKQSDLNRNVQFTLYSKAARLLFEEDFDCQENAICYYHLRSGKFLRTQRNEKHFDYLKELLDTTAEEIDVALETGKFTPFYDDFRCSWCEFRNPCEKYSICPGGPKITEEPDFVPINVFDSFEDIYQYADEE